MCKFGGCVGVEKYRLLRRVYMVTVGNDKSTGIVSGRSERCCMFVMYSWAFYIIIIMSYIKKSRQYIAFLILICTTLSSLMLLNVCLL